MAYANSMTEFENVEEEINFSIKRSSIDSSASNAGGKTVVLKTIGLLTLAAMSGFHVIANKETEISVFENIFVDIGDNQSIENVLSTFLSHMKKLSEIMRASNNNTLLLFDEIGSGTEPNEGATLDISILEEFYHMGCIMHDDFMNAVMQTMIHWNLCIN